jgi:glycosyltransferase involved in cell wall biosynthesis
VLNSGTHDVVLAFLDGLPVGIAHLTTRIHPRVVLVSLVALTQEQRHRRIVPVLRAMARATAGRPLHPDVLRAIAPGAIPTVIFPTEAWRDAAVSAGVPPQCAQVITLGVPIARDLPQRDLHVATPARLLWLGRLSPEKGLHLFIEALSMVSARRPVRLTAIAAPGPSGYRQLVMRALADRGLQSIVDLRPAVPRHALKAEFERHDLLLFHSVFGEPVAQVMLHAAAAGLPVVGPASDRSGSLVREGQTAWCFADSSPEHIADAIMRALDAGDERRLRARALHEEIRAGHSLADTIARFDVTMRICAGRVDAAEAEWQTVHS